MEYHIDLQLKVLYYKIYVQSLLYTKFKDIINVVVFTRNKNDLGVFGQ